MIEVRRRRWIYTRNALKMPPALDLLADAVCGRQGPAGADQSAAAERTAILFLRLKPH